MALFGNRGDEGSAALESAGLAPAPSGRQSLSAFIDQGSEFEGKLSFKDTVRIDGCFRGEIASENTLVVGETGEIFATVRSRTVVIAGSVTGDVIAKDRLVLQKTARLDGDVETSSLQMEDGAVLNGRIAMKKGA
jgi:cytoskeletal protein CcmA (bactofilin family)